MRDDVLEQSATKLAVHSLAVRIHAEGTNVKALTWHGKSDMRCESVPDPRIEHPRDAIIKVTACAICGSDLHIFDGVIPGMKHGDVLGHETMGEVVEVGSGNKKLKPGDRVVVPFTIACGECYFCRKGFFSGCERTNPDKNSGFGSVWQWPKPIREAKMVIPSWQVITFSNESF